MNAIRRKMSLSKKAFSKALKVRAFFCTDQTTTDCPKNLAKLVFSRASFALTHSRLILPENIEMKITFDVLTV